MNEKMKELINNVNTALEKLSRIFDEAGNKKGLEIMEETAVFINELEEQLKQIECLKNLLEKSRR
jgi:uncharacterized protein YajQ (UPF0234 family)